MCTGVDLWDVITSVKFRFEDFSDFDGMGVKIRPLPLTLHVGLNHSAAHTVLPVNSEQYQLACETQCEWWLHLVNMSIKVC